MSSTYSTNLALELIGTGDQAGVWGNTTNTNLGTLIEQAISGYVTQAVSTGTDTTITIPNGATGVARNMYIELTGTGGSNTNLIVPANKKLYFIFNNSTGAVTVKVSGQTGVSVPAGKKVVLVSNGTDVVNGLNYIADFGTNSFTVTNITATSANITTLTSASGTITNLLGTTLTISGNSFLATSSGNVGIGTASPAAKLDVSGAIRSANAGNVNLLLNDGSTTSSIQQATNTLFFNVNGDTGINGSFAWRSGNSFAERMRLDSSGNLGIGTASPAQKLHVASAGSNYIVSHNTAGSTSALLLGAESGQNTIYSWTTVAGSTGRPLAFYTGASEAMRLDTSGNLGIGTASPTFGSGSGLEIERAGVATLRLENSSASNSFELYVDSAANGVNLRGRDSSPMLFWTANTERMRLDASGNLGIGTTSPSVKLEVRNDVLATTSLAATSIKLNNGSDGGAGIEFGNAVSGKSKISFGVEGTGSATDDTFLAFSTCLNAGALTERMRLDSSGNLGIGTSSPTYLIDTLRGAGSGNIARLGQSGVSNGYTITTSGSALTHEWATAGSVSMKIDANANIVAGASVALATNATNGFLYVPTCAGTPTGTPTAITGMAPIIVDTTNNKLYFYSGGAWRDAGP